MSKKKYCQPKLIAVSCTTEGEVFATSAPSTIHDGGAFNVVPTNRTPLQSFSNNASSISSPTTSDYTSNAKEESVTDLLDEF